MRACLLVLALAGCDHVFGLGDPYQDASRISDVSDDIATDSPGRLDDAMPPPTQLIAHFSFDVDITDDTHTYNGTDYGNIGTPAGHKNNGLSLDGASCVEVPIPATPAAFTIAFWARPASTTGGALFSRRPEPTAMTHSYQVYESPAGGGFGFSTLAGTGEVNNIVVSTFATDVWHHYAVTYDGATKYQYVDGLLVGSQAAGPVVYGSENREYIGCIDATSNYFIGMIDELYLYGRALTQSEIGGLASM